MPLAQAPLPFRMGRRRKTKGRNVQGILLMDKPAGMSSNELLQSVKRLYGAAKAGHTGSLDKTATGLLPLCFGAATRFAGYLLDADKKYIASCKLGRETSTGDAAGEVVYEREVPELSKARLEEVLACFRGEIQQVPPMYSALKHKGQRLYALAYQGIEVERAPRPVTIQRLELIGHGPEEISIALHCSKGTYVRTLAQDIGRQLGCGAHLSKLRRTASGPFTEEGMLTMEQLKELALQGTAALDKCLLGIDSLLPDIPSVQLVDAVAYYLCRGQPVTVPHAPTEGMLRLYNEDQVFLGLGEVLDDGRVAPKRLVGH